MRSVAQGRDHPANEVRVTINGNLAGYVKYALKCFKKEYREVVLKGTGTATARVPHLAEILKGRIGNLHQSNSVYSIIVNDNRGDHSNEDGKRRISVFEIILSLDPLDKEAPGYQEPIPKDPR